MSKAGKIKTVLATCSVAFGIGFVMQYGESPASFSDDETRQEFTLQSQSIATLSNASGEPIFGVPSIVTTSLPHLQNVETVAQVNDIYIEIETPSLGPLFATPFSECQADMIAKVMDAAMVSLIVSSPCHQEEIFVVRHAGLMFSGHTDADGYAVLQVPALSENARFSLSFSNIEMARAQVNVPDIRDYDRAVLQWYGVNNLQLHALEFGAELGDPGHVWTASSNGTAQTTSGERGFTVRLGDAHAEIPMVAEIYTFPSGMTNRYGQIILQVGVFVTPENCNRKINAQSIELHFGRLLAANDLSIHVPDCTMIGKSLMVRNLFRPMVFAAR